ncbi:MFS transporter [Nocardia terrae]|uniref:MFS transporter n=1 Tax=Nocardia terrae TaxID=2675851 RepID=UPI001F32117A|nr:MFS transporter [Nocardia terrae]
MAATTPAPRIRKARLALFAVFGLNGMLSAVWIVHIPAVTARTGVAPATLGMLILLMAACAILGMQAAGPLADRFGSRTLTALAATLLSLALLGPAYADSPVTLGLALSAFGFGNGAIDVSMNAQAVHIERAYPRPIMSAFHAFFSCGGFLGSAFGAATQHAHWPVHATFALSSAFGLATVAAAIPKLLPHSETRAHSVPNPSAPSAEATAVHGRCPDAAAADDRSDPRPNHESVFGSAAIDADPGTAQHLPAPSGAATPTEGSPVPGAEPVLGRALTSESAEAGPTAWRDTTNRPATRNGGDQPGTVGDPVATAGSTSARVGDAGRIGRKVLALGLIAFALLMAEGVAADWSALQVKGRLAVEAGTAALAFTGFSLTMTLGRFGADRVSARFGRVAIVRWGTVLAAIGFGLVIVSGWLPLTLLGWTLCGVGLAGGVPQVFTAAGNMGSKTSATDMSRVFGLGYVGLLAGPAIIGWLSKLMPLTVAMVVPLLAMLACAWGARAVAASSPAHPSGR